LPHWLQVTIVTGAKTAGDVKAFEKAYGKPPKRMFMNGDAVKFSTMVLRVPWMKYTWAIVTNMDGPAEW
jgi:hypothetical protein